MRVISIKLLRSFWEKYPDAEQPLRQWYKTAEQLVNIRNVLTHNEYDGGKWKE